MGSITGEQPQEMEEGFLWRPEGQEEMETLCGYIQKIENGAVWIDQVEYVEESDMERIRELGLTEADMAGRLLYL